MKKNNKVLPSTRILSRYVFVAAITVVFIVTVIPIVLNYPPDSLNNAFDIQMSGIPFFAQVAAIFVGVGFFLIAAIKILFRQIDDWYKNPDTPKNKSLKTVQKIREKCFKLPFVIFGAEVIFPVVGVVTVLTVTGSHDPIMIFKILLLFISLFLLYAVFSYIFSKSIYTEILQDTYSEKIVSFKKKVPLSTKILLQVLPISIMGILFTSLLAYCQVVKATEDNLYSLYYTDLHLEFDTTREYDYGEIINKFAEYSLFNVAHDKYIIKPDGSVLTLHGYEPSYFMVEYTKQKADQNRGRTYDGYGVDRQGTSIKVKTNDGIYTLVVSYPVYSSEALVYLLVDFTLVIILTVITLSAFANSIEMDVSAVSKQLSNMANLKKNTKLPIASNDELGELCEAYNKVQELNVNNIQQIKNSQDLLIERERLASLGQMIGGVAHNLKTPIMSIAGADEGLSQLVDELDRSIGNPVVTNDDYHAIANDMREWIDKIKTHTSYMSDVITAVKGQAVTLSDDQVFLFSTEDLFKQVDILMKHELKSNVATLNIKNNVSPDVKIQGNINSLVQILNNMISNSIQAYGLRQDKNIDLIANLKDNTIELLVRDYGSGLSKEVKEKLFKQMITTKGKDGTGLGLFMSYSNIKAHFHGNIEFESEEGKGTTFIITIPTYDPDSL